MNNLLPNSSNTPVVGMGASILYYTDREAATIVEVNKSGKTIWVTEDTSKRIDKNGAFSEAQEYEYTSNPDGHKICFTLRENGSWVRKGESMRGGTRLIVGARMKYRDPHF